MKIKVVSKKFTEPYHIKQLAESGLSPEFALANGLRPVTALYIRRVFGWEVDCGGIEILYPKSAFEYYSDFSRVRLDVPITLKPKTERPEGVYHKKQNTIRYLSRKGTKNRLYIPKKVWPVLGDPSIPLFFVEGEKKALKMVHDGYMAIGLPGIYGAYCDGKLLTDFDLIDLKERQCYTAFDGDKYSNINVRRAEHKLLLDLLERGLR